MAKKSKGKDAALRRPSKAAKSRARARARNRNRTAKPRDPAKAHLDSARKNSARMQPGHVENDATTGQRVIHPAANPQQVNPIHDAAHEKAAVTEAKVLTDPEASHREKIKATAKSNKAEGAPGTSDHTTEATGT